VRVCRSHIRTRTEQGVDMHPLGQERFRSISPTPERTWVGDLPSADPTDWFESAEEYYEFIGYDEFVGYDPDDDEDELLEDERLIDEY